MTDNSPIQTVSNAERAKLRSVIKDHPRWPALRKARGINIADLSSSKMVLDVCRTLLIDVNAALNGDAQPDPKDPAPMYEPAVTVPQPTQSSGIEGLIRAIVREEAANVPGRGGAGDFAVTINDTTREVSGAAHKQLPRLIFMTGVRDARGNRQNIMVFGPRGCGKSQAARQVAEAHGLDFYQHGKMEFAEDLLGFVNQVSGEFHTKPFLLAYEFGGVVLLDELDRWDPNAQTALNGALADGELWLADGRCIKRHPDCVVIGTANTRGTGADRKYTGANRLDAAFLDRFAMKIEWTLDLQLEAALLDNDALHKHIKSVRRKLLLHDIDCEVTTRHALAMADLMRAGASLDEAAEMTYLVDMTSEQQEMLANV